MTSPAGTTAAVATSPKPTVTWPRVITMVLVSVAVTIGHVWYGDRHHFYDLHIYYAAINWWADGRPL